MKADCPVWAPPLLAIQFLTRVPVPAVSGPKVTDNCRTKFAVHVTSLLMPVRFAINAVAGVESVQFVPVQRSKRKPVLGVAVMARSLSTSTKQGLPLGQVALDALTVPPPLAATS